MTPGELIIIECMVGMLCLCTVGKYEVSSVVKIEENACSVHWLCPGCLCHDTRPLGLMK